jgi:serine/threonine protein kinase
MLEIGEHVGAYTIVRKIGAGGMAEVFLGQHRHIDRTVAIKVLRPEISIQKDVTARFFAEARAASSIEHPGIVEILDCDVMPDGRAYIVMEYLSGQSLRELLADGARPLAADRGLVLRILIDVAEALGAAHAKGIVHRDLKPDNVFMVQDERGALEAVKVLDFGIAKLVRGVDSVHQTRTGSLLGTPLYMSPEQCRGITDIDHRSDIYSLGCLAFELVTLSPPFVREAPGDLLMAHMSEVPPSLASIHPSVPAELDGLVSQMLAKTPAARPSSMGEVIARLEQLRTRGGDTLHLPAAPPGRPPSVSPSQPWRGPSTFPPAATAPLERSPWPPLATGPGSTTFSRSTAELVRRPPSRLRWPLGVLGVVLFAAAAVLLLSSPGSRRSPHSGAIPVQAVPPMVEPLPSSRGQWTEPARPSDDELPPRREEPSPTPAKDQGTPSAAGERSDGKRSAPRSRRRGVKVKGAKPAAGDDYRYIED